MATSNNDFHTQVAHVISELEAGRPVQNFWCAGLIRKLQEGVARLQADSQKLASAFILRHPLGGYSARLPWRPQGYPRGREIEPGLYHFDLSEDVMAAALEVGGEVRRRHLEGS